MAKQKGKNSNYQTEKRLADKRAAEAAAAAKKDAVFNGRKLTRQGKTKLKAKLTQILAIIMAVLLLLSGASAAIYGLMSNETTAAAIVLNTEEIL